LLHKPQALVLENALATLHTDAIIGDFHVDAPETGRASVLGAALQQWLAAVLAAPGLQPSQKRRR
jgi:hypothetical protein